jgi:hypothetical protein
MPGTVADRLVAIVSGEGGVVKWKGMMEENSVKGGYVWGFILASRQKRPVYVYSDDYANKATAKREGVKFAKHYNLDVEWED